METARDGTGPAADSAPWEDDAFCADRYLDTAILTSLMRLRLADAAAERAARSLIVRFGTLAQVVHADQAAWSRVAGIEPEAVKALSVLKAALASVARVRTEHRPVLESWTDLLRYVRYDMSGAMAEHFRVIYCNDRFVVLRDRRESEGTVNAAAVYPREIVRAALELGATKLFLVHNHPSGSLTFSDADIEITRRLVAAGEHLGIAVHDHLLIASTGHASMRDAGLL